LCFSTWTSGKIAIELARAFPLLISANVLDLLGVAALCLALFSEIHNRLAFRNHDPGSAKKSSVGFGHRELKLLNSLSLSSSTGIRILIADIQTWWSCRIGVSFGEFGLV
jgi:hypothetical protein